MEALSPLVVTLLLNSLWQVALLAGAAELADRLLRRGPARYRHLLWNACLAVAVLLPLSTLRPRPAALPNAAPNGPSEMVALPDAAQPIAIRIVRPKVPSADPWWIALATLSSRSTLSLPRPLVRVSLMLYLFFVAFMMARFGRACLSTRRVRRLAQAIHPLPPRLAEALNHCRRSLRPGSHRRPLPAILSSTQIAGPVTAGVRRPAILLPATLFERGAQEDLTSALAHEMAHIIRRDYLWNLIFELLYLPLSFHPLALLIRRRIGGTRELACDELAAQAVSTSTYARSLVRLAQQMSRQAGVALTPNYTLGVFDANILEERVMRLLKPHASGHLAKLSLVFAALLISSLSVAATRFSLTVAQATESSTSAHSTPEDASKFLGTWIAVFDGKTYVQLKLSFVDHKVTGAISTGEVNTDGAGNVNEVTQEAQAPVAIFDTKMRDGKFYFKQKDGSDTLDYELEVNDAGRASLKVLNSGGVRIQPFKLAKDTSAARGGAPAVRPVAYSGKSHAITGGVSGGIGHGVARGISGSVPGGVSGAPSAGFEGGVSKVSGVAGGDPRPQSDSQQKTGNLSGIVVDSSGARIPNAEVRLVSRNNSFQKSAQSGETGDFSFEDVPAGRYTLQVSSNGMGGTFRSFEFKAEGQPPFFPFVLHPGSVVETVAVTAKSPHALGDKAAKMGPHRIRIGGEVQAAKLIEGAQPAYPEAAKERGAQGIVVIEATLSDDGTPQDLKVISSPDDDLTKAAVDAVREWRYQPTLLNGEPVQVVTTVEVNFTLQD